MLWFQRQFNLQSFCGVILGCSFFLYCWISQWSLLVLPKEADSLPTPGPWCPQVGERSLQTVGMKKLPRLGACCSTSFLPMSPMSLVRGGEAQVLWGSESSGYLLVGLLSDPSSWCCWAYLVLLVGSHKSGGGMKLPEPPSVARLWVRVDFLSLLDGGS